MHDIKQITENLEEVKKNLGNRKFDVNVLDDAVTLNEKRKELLSVVENKRADIKKISKEVGANKKAGEDAADLMKQVGLAKKEIEESEKELEQVQRDLNDTLAGIPNLLASDVPVGLSEEFNKEIKSWGSPTELSFEAKDHVVLGEELGMLDFEIAAKITGSRFVVYKNDLARLERALINFMLDHHQKNGYEEIIPPFIINSQSMYGTGQLPKFAEDSFKIEGRDWYLAPTAEVPLTNLVAKKMLVYSELPIKYAAYTPCFRSEAGSYGKDTRGLIRLHQFNKVEMVNIVRPEASEEAHQAMIDSACNLLEKLKIPYRSMLLCSGDIGFGATKCIDLEVWLPGQKKYREISSISNCGPFQARRAGIRFRNEEGKPEFAHTLNGSGLALGRTVVSIMENYQTEAGQITIPEVLRPYMGGQELISKK